MQCFNGKANYIACPNMIKQKINKKNTNYLAKKDSELFKTYELIIEMPGQVGVKVKVGIKFTVRKTAILEFKCINFGNLLF